MITLLETAIAIAVKAHAGQVDKAGAPYILHPLRVMLKGCTEQEMIVGVLHDVVEDCEGWSLDRLHSEGFGPISLEALDSVTKRTGEGYPDFVRRAARNEIGRAVKLHDLEDNLDLRRLRQVTPADEERLAKYRSAIEQLQEEGAV